jgi:hypothetical protein
MTDPGPRSGPQRKADTLAKLQGHEVDVWVASASATGSGAADPYLVPLTLAWIDERVVIAVEETSRTARNIVQHRTARLGLGPTRDVVIIDALLDQLVSVDSAPPELARRYADQAAWDPRNAGQPYVYLLLRPDRIQAWREVNELPGRTLMRDGSWLV